MSIIKIFFYLRFCSFLIFVVIGYLNPDFSQITNSGLMTSGTGEQLGNLRIGAYLDA